MLQTFLKDEFGATSIEYGLVGSLVAVAIMVSLTGLGTTIADGYDLVGDAMADAAGGPPADTPNDLNDTPPVEVPNEFVEVEPVFEGNNAGIR